MKKTLIICMLTMLFAVQVSANDLGKIPTTDIDRTPIQWVNYLSPAEQSEIALQLAQEEFVVRQANGTLFEDNERSRETISFPIHLSKRVESSSGVSSSKNVSSSGNITCGPFNVQNPHASGPVVKAKLSGTCTYTHGTGPNPPPITYNLNQMLIGSLIGGHGYPFGAWSEAHPKIGLSVEWFADGQGQTGTQVFSTSCINGAYMQAGYIFIVPPPGYFYTGTQPVSTGVKSAVVLNC